MQQCDFSHSSGVGIGREGGREGERERERERERVREGGRDGVREKERERERESESEREMVCVRGSKRCNQNCSFVHSNMFHTCTVQQSLTSINFHSNVAYYTLISTNT